MSLLPGMGHMSWAVCVYVNKCVCAKQHKIDVRDIQCWGHMAHGGCQQPQGSLCDTLSQQTRHLHPTFPTLLETEAKL